ncbi:hypothetical protein [Streptomyces otsuchiensis]|uniref:hypothetical protein n=1 Tax=Streptomyces otsuchiensis TaxID=2681388 RepID=UPI0010314092|nr:hypothetical protein [Streptomyces otsuchiensis]
MNGLVHDALERHLPLDGALTTVGGLHDAITALVIEVGQALVGSAEYTAAFALVSQWRWQHPGSRDDVMTVSAEEALAGRIAHFTAAGLLDTDDPHTASHHLAAPTLLLAYNDQPDPATADSDHIRKIVTVGSRAFVRAHAVR